MVIIYRLLLSLFLLLLILIALIVLLSCQAFFAAIASALPLDPFIASVNLSKSAALAFTMVSKPDILLFPLK